MLRYATPYDWTITFSDDVLQLFRTHRQANFWNREAGGQLFADLNGDTVIIKIGTGPRKSDRRGPWHYWPDRRAEQAEIDEFHASGLHYVGDWHTHSQPRPTPSNRDFRTFEGRVKSSVHNLNAFVYVIVGQEEPPEGLLVLLHDGDAFEYLNDAAVV